MINFEYTRATTAKAATDARIKNRSSQFIAGGTNLVDLMKKGITTPDRLIDINALPLKDIISDAKGLSIGAFSDLKKPLHPLSNFKTSNSLVNILAGIFAKENHFDDCFIYADGAGLRCAEDMASTLG